MLRSRIHAGAVITAATLLATAGCARRSVARVPAPPPSVRAGSIENGVASWYGAPYDGRRAASGEIYDMEQLTAAHRTLPFDTWVEVTNLSNRKRVDVRINDRGPFVDGRVIDLSYAAAREIDMLGPGTARVRLKVIAPQAKAIAARPRPSTRSMPASQPSPSQLSTLPTTSAGSAAEGLCAPAGSESPPRVLRVATPAPASTRASETSRSTGETYAVQAGAFSSRERAAAFQVTLAEIFQDTRVVEPAGGSPLWRVVIGSRMTLQAAILLAARVQETSGEAVVVQDPGKSSPDQQ